MKAYTAQFRILFLLFFSCLVSGVWGQLPESDKKVFSRQDSLRGSITPERAWWDVTYYDLSLEPNLENQTLEGLNRMHFRVLQPGKVMQIDLQEPMELSSVRLDGKAVDFTRLGNVYQVKFPKELEVGEIYPLDLQFRGEPRKAIRAPWDGGFSWSKDRNGNPFVATSCQGLGASVWWPNKDHAYDEPDSMRIRSTAPKGLMAVMNGRLEESRDLGDRNRYTWVVRNPINNYGVNLNIGDYVRIGDTYQGLKGKLDLSYYVLRYQKQRAEHHFRQVKGMLDAFEYWFGPYPFYEDGYKLVEVPYLGMEHQSSVTYGNGYENGYLGRDLSGTGQGMKFDFIIVHESGHEWFANNITAADSADLWIHESFTSYGEALYLEYHYGFEAAQEYVVGYGSSAIQNDRPLIGPYGVNKEGSPDMYSKGSYMLHTLRLLVEDKELWRSILTGLNEEFYHQTVSTRQIEDYLSEKTGKDLTAFFNQYLRTANIPRLEYRLRNGQFQYRYARVVQDFDMPVEVFLDGKPSWIFPDSDWKTHEGKVEQASLNPGFLVDFVQVQ